MKRNLLLCMLILGLVALAACSTGPSGGTEVENPDVDTIAMPKGVYYNATFDVRVEFPAQWRYDELSSELVLFRAEGVLDGSSGNASFTRLPAALDDLRSYVALFRPGVVFNGYAAEGFDSGLISAETREIGGRGYVREIFLLSNDVLVHVELAMATVATLDAFIFSTTERIPGEEAGAADDGGNSVKGPSFGFIKPADISTDKIIVTPTTDVDGDSDGISDSADNCLYVINPSQEDSDDDGVGDACETSGKDSDSDGLSDECEAKLGTDPMNGDSDNDGLRDGEEDSNQNCTRDAGEANPLDADTDDDGLSDYDEWRDGSNPAMPDTDGDGILDWDELYGCASDPDVACTGAGVRTRDVKRLESAQECRMMRGISDVGENGIELPGYDSDSDGLMDDEEDANFNCQCDAGETCWSKADTDYDTIKDDDEKPGCALNPDPAC